MTRPNGGSGCMRIAGSSFVPAPTSTRSTRRAVDIDLSRAMPLFACSGVDESALVVRPSDWGVLLRRMPFDRTPDH